MEIRGSVAKLDAFNKIIRNPNNNKLPYDGRYGLLLWLNKKPGVLLKPKGISLSLITSNLQ
jgi:hypothetical protein